MDTKTKVKELFSYLLSVKNMDEEVMRNINQYDKLYWKEEFENKDGVFLYNDEGEEWLEVGKENKKLYDSFFQLYLLIQKNSENMEIVWGNHILAWNNEDKKILHPIFTTKMELSFDAENGKFLLKPYDNRTIMELDMLGGMNIPNLDKIIEIKNEFENGFVDVRNIGNVKEVLYKIVHYLSSEINPEGEIKEKIEGSNAIKLTAYPAFYEASLIIVRKTDSRLWNKELSNIIEAIDLGYHIPLPIKSLVETEKIEESDTENEEWKSVGENLLFPLPANEEQKEVVQKLCDNFGVVVQGPPGTGKSHTIVNLICHLLAHGKRVLVTSQTGRALKVLSDKVPEEIRPLCMSLLGDDTKALKNLDDSVRKITENLSLNPEDINKEVIPLKKELSDCRIKQEKLYEKIKEAESIETKKLNIKGEVYTLMEIAKWVRKNENELNWIEDEISMDRDCPINDQQFAHFIYLLNSVNNKDINKVNSALKIFSELPQCDEVCSTVQDYTELEKEYSKNKENIKGWSLPYDEKVDYDKVINLLDKAEDRMDFIEKSWLKDLMICYYSSEVERPEIKHLYVKSSEYIRRLSDIQSRVVSHKINICENKDFDKFRDDFTNIYSHIKSSGKINKLYKTFHRKYRYIFKECSVDKDSIEYGEQAEILKAYLDKKDIEKELMELWNSTVKKFNGEEIKEFNADTFVKIEREIRNLGEVVNWNINYRSKIVDSLGEITFLNNIDWYKKDTYSYLKRGILSIRNIKNYDKEKAYISGITKMCRNTYGIDCLTDGIDKRDTQKIKKAYGEILRLKELIPAVKEINVFKNKLEAAAPLFTSKLLKSSKRESYKNISKAWKWKQMNGFLKKAHNLRTDILEKNIENEKIREKVLIKEIVAKKAWYNQIVNTTDVQKRSLYAWLQAVKRIGKGRSKFALKYISMAQREMEKCKDCIPVWIMPLNKVIENIKLNKNLFDVVIFDESSQSDIFGLSALIRGKRAVIVGDDKQISPQAVGIGEENIDELIDRHLKEIPHSEWFDLQTSLYNTALRVFPDRLLLREHFRCAPEIIGFSNNLSYSGEIIPLRYPRGKEAFVYPIKAMRVKNGSKDNMNQINDNEARAIVDQIVKCCNNPQYANMTMGVISLLGEKQAELIEILLRHRIGEREILRRKLLCGDAYSFQGDERDVMFLSMVISDNSKFTSLTREVDFRRFNVAASRARNQMWVFYSIDEDKLSSDCVRTKFLRYCLDPNITVHKNNSDNMILAGEFERDVFNAVKRRGYDIKPFVGLGKYKVDFIIEDENNRIAVECDGGRWSNIEDWEKHRERQMALERVGWIFYRIRGSEFYRNQDRTVNRLLAKLNEMGIKKVTA